MVGVRFTCQSGCTRCCEQQGYVYVTDRDVGLVARRLRMSKSEFEKRYVYRTKHTARLRKPRDKQCPFLSGDGCSIHPAKPTQCRLFPFWPELVEEQLAWRRTAVWCPGIGKGELIHIGTALETASEMKRAYPSMYED